MNGLISTEDHALDLTIDRDYLVKTLTDLVAINSINLSLVPSGPGEAEIAAFMAQSMRDLGLDVTLHEAQHSRISAVGILRGSGQGRSLMLNGHTDTAGVEGMENPFRAMIKAGNLYGRGAYDMKGSLAACMTAVKAPIDDNVSLATAGVETVIIGPIGAGLHAVEEWVDIQSLADLAQILAESAVLYCR